MESMHWNPWVLFPSVCLMLYLCCIREGGKLAVGKREGSMKIIETEGTDMSEILMSWTTKLDLWWCGQAAQMQNCSP